MKWYVWAGIGVVVLVVVVVIVKNTTKSNSQVASNSANSGFDPYKLTQIV